MKQFGYHMPKLARVQDLSELKEAQKECAERLLLVGAPVEAIILILKIDKDHILKWRNDLFSQKRIYQKFLD
jgi:hypothetical protein